MRKRKHYVGNNKLPGRAIHGHIRQRGRWVPVVPRILVPYYILQLYRMQELRWCGEVFRFRQGFIDQGAVTQRRWITPLEYNRPDTLEEIREYYNTLIREIISGSSVTILRTATTTH